MRVAFVLAVALLCVALASAGRGEKQRKDGEGKHQKNKEHYKKDDRSKSEKSWKSKENKQKSDGKRNKREENIEENNGQEQGDVNSEVREDRGKESKGKKKDKRSAERPIEESQKKKSKKNEGTAKKEEWSKKNKKQEKPTKTEETKTIVEEDVVIEEEPVEEVIVEDESESVDGECQQDRVDDCGQDEPEVVLPSGAKIQGKKGKTVSGKETAEFQGVPYAEPPQGEQRLKEAVLKETWPGVLKATTASNDCLQFSHFTYSVYGSEDCLYLNIYTPKLPKSGIKNAELLPVVVYIHGGAFMFFSSAIAGPKYLLEKDLVLVTLNYRLGPLGFFILGDDTVPGNLGLRDQMTALKWVRNNIKAFGGDANRVTIAGMSAGGASVHYHLLSPLSKGLFNQAISISGSALNPWAEAENLVEKSQSLAKALGCRSKSSQAVVNCLRSRSADSIVRISKSMQTWLYNPISPWAPSPEPKSAANPFLPDSPINIILDGKANDVPWMVSYTNQEGGYPGAEFVFDDKHKKHLEENWLSLIPHLMEFNYTAPPEKHDEISSKIKQFYLKGKLATDPQAIQPLIDMQSDRLFLEGIVEAAVSHARIYKSPVYTYLFSHLGQTSVANLLCHCNSSLDGACHADDVGYVLDAIIPVLTSDEDLAVSQKMVSMWHSFISTGKPNFGGTDLPQVNGAAREMPLLNIGQNGVTSLVSNVDWGNQEFWSSLGLSDVQQRTLATLHQKDEL